MIVDLAVGRLARAIWRGRCVDKGEWASKLYYINMIYLVWLRNLLLYGQCSIFYLYSTDDGLDRNRVVMRLYSHLVHFWCDKNSRFVVD
jgi:hypothetical protein